jgi:preprotein translocase subunit SecA
VEARNFDVRKQLLEYDDVSNDQRKVIYQQRNDILDAQDLSAQITSLREGCFTDLVRQFVPVESVEEQWDIPALERALAMEWQINLGLQAWIEGATSVSDEDVVEKVVSAAHAAFATKVVDLGAGQLTPFTRAVLLQSIDNHWREHLSSLDYLRQGIHLRGYAQKQPKQEYKREAFELFGQLLDQVKAEVTRILMNMQIQSQQQIDEAAQALEAQAEKISNVTYTAPSETGEAYTYAGPSSEFELAPQGLAKVGRNEPCPCGSGKKFKNCHGKLA